jgi:curved DNA-binding protein CbpA
VLGLRPGASKAEILSAHRRLMRGAHPDTGGSDWLAARINLARDVLLG